MTLPKNRKVATRGGDGYIRLIEENMPEIKKGSVLVKVHASLVSPGTELKDWKTYSMKRFNPDPNEKHSVFGYSNAGIVEATGEGVGEFRRGDRVACIGGGYALHSDYAIVPHNLCVALPENVSFEQGSYAMLLATAIAVPVGVWLTRAPGWAKPVIAVANILQTIPSLAMFGFLLPLPWLGDRAARIAIVALTAYALLPIVRNTYAGIRGIDPAILEVARALGLTGWQRLRMVELPLAASFIFAGLRTATVTCVGIATIAAAVGAGGLGELIFRGVASVDNRLVLAGAIPAALLALVADAALGLLERRFKVAAQ